MVSIVGIEQDWFSVRYTGLEGYIIQYNCCSIVYTRRGWNKKTYR